MNDVPTATGWRVTSQQETTQVGDNGQLVDGFRVYFTTAGGTAASVFIPHATYNADTVRTAISALAAHIDTIGSLTG